MNEKIFIATILLEKNRWKSRQPSFKVSEWIDRFKSDGFDGIELWENHVLLNSNKEIDRLKESNFPIAVYNTYVGFDDKQEKARLKAAKIIKQLGAKAVKYNFGNDFSKTDEYITNLKEWVKLLPDKCRILCECHSGTIMDDPIIANKIINELSAPCYQVIIHPLNDLEKTKKWFDHLDSRITHVHLSLRDDNNNGITLETKSDYVIKCLQILFDYGFNGTYSLEFTEGIRTPNENIDDLYHCAQKDIKFVKKILLQYQSS